MASFNKVILIGNLTADPELKQTPNGVSVCRFTLAVNRRFVRSEQGQQSADFITVVTWRQSAEFVSKYFKKGRPILVCGQLQSRSWTDQAGQKRYATEVVVDEAMFVDSRTDSAAQSNYVPDAYGSPSFSSGDAPNFEEVKTDDDLPF